MNSHSGTFTTTADSYIRVTGGSVVYHGTHSHALASVTVNAMAQLALTPDQATTSGDLGIGSYSAEGWSGCSEAVTNYGIFQLKAINGISVQ